MTNEELKKKILEIFDKAIGDWYEKDDGLFADGYTPEEGDNRFKAFIADALIAAGIGDVKEAQEIGASATAMAVFEAAKAEHRAEVAEREAIILSKWLADKTRKDYPYQAWLEAAQKQAKKELAEEGK